MDRQFLDGYENPIATRGPISGRIRQEVLRQEARGNKARIVSYVIIPSSGIYRKMGHKTFYRLFGLHYFNKDDHPKTGGFQKAHDMAHSRIFVKDGTYGFGSAVDWNKQKLHWEGESMACILQPTADNNIFTYDMPVAGNHRSRLKNFRFDDPDATGKQTGAHGAIFFTHGNCTDSVFEDLLFTGKLNRDLTTDTLGAGYDGTNGIADTWFNRMFFGGGSNVHQPKTCAVDIGTHIDCHFDDWAAQCLPDSITQPMFTFTCGSPSGTQFRDCELIMGTSGGNANSQAILKFVSQSAIHWRGGRLEVPSSGSALFDALVLDGNHDGSTFTDMHYAGGKLRDAIHILNTANGNGVFFMDKCDVNQASGSTVALHDEATTAIPGIIFRDCDWQLANTTFNPNPPVQRSFYLCRMKSTGGGANVQASELGFAVSTPGVPGNNVALQNTSGFRIRIHFLTTGTVTVITITDPNGTAQAITTAITLPCTVILDPMAKITLTYSGAPTWKWYAE